MELPCLLPDGRLIIDERCTCGALKSEHQTHRYRHTKHKGPCPRTGCGEYTWAEFVFAAPAPPPKPKP